MTTITMKEVAAFLLGEASLDGYWFGERHPISPFWWREHLRAALSEIDMTLEAMSAALAAPATAPEHLEWPEFEPWAQYVGMNVSKDANGYYTSEATDMAWQAWEMAKNQKMTVGPPETHNAGIQRASPASGEAPLE